MTDDIVTRLRNEAETFWDVRRFRPLWIEAADEIERLRAESKQRQSTGVTISWVDKDPLGTPTIMQRQLPELMTMEEAIAIQDFIQELINAKNDLLRYADVLRQRQYDTKEKLLHALDIITGRYEYFQQPEETEAENIERCKSCNQLTYQCICSYPHKHQRKP